MANGSSPTCVSCDEQLYNHIIDIHEVFNTDAERVMLLAGDEVTTPGAGGQAVLPQNVLHVKDPTHGARRVLQRPWECHAELKDIVDTIALKKTSIMQRVHNSLVFTEKLQYYLKQLPGDDPLAKANQRVRNLSSAKHRFDAVVSPLVRFVLFFSGLMVLAIDIAISRAGEDVGKDMALFVVYVSGKTGYRRLILCAMMSDGGLEILIFIRWWDTEEHDAAQIRAQISTSCLGSFSKEIVSRFPKVAHTTCFRRFAPQPPPSLVEWPTQWVVQHTKMSSMIASVRCVLG